MKRLFASVVFLFALSVLSHAQILQDLKNKAKSLNTKENREKVVKAVMSDMEAARAKFDSTDFDYAILLSDNSGLFDVKEKGENAARVTSMLSYSTSYMKNSELSDADKARFNLEMGEVFYASTKLTMAEKRFASAKTLYEQGSLTEDLGYLKTISNQGLLYATMGRFTQAEAFTKDALEKRKAKFGDSNASVAASLNNYAVLKYNLARYNESEKDFESAVGIIKTKGLTTGMSYAIVLNNQAMLFQAVGRYAEAETALKEAIGIAEKLQSNKSKNHLKFLSNLALLYRQMGKYAEAEAIYGGMEKRLGKNNPDYASMLNNQAALYMVMGKEDKVEDLLKKSVAIYKSNFGEENPAYAKSTSDLGNFYRYKTRYTDAEPLLEKALAVRETTLGKTHPLYVQSQEDLAILAWKKKAWDRAFMTYRDVMDKSLDFVNNYFPPMSEAEKTKYWDVLSPRFQLFYNFAVEASTENPAVVQDLYDYQIATKALLLSSTNKVKQSILASKDAALIKDYLTWLDQKETLARLYAYSKDELNLQKINLDSLQRAANGMEKKLSERSTEFSAGYSAQKMSYKQIKSLLTDTEAVVEIIRVQKYDQAFTADAKYLALVLTKTSEMPKLVVLDNGQQLDTRYAKFYRNAIHQHVADEYSYDQYWARIEAELAGKKMIYISPDGSYNELNLNTMKKPDGDYVINRYDLVILGNSKDLIAIKARKQKAIKKNGTLLGFPDYGGSSIAALPGTKVEIDGISKILKANAWQLKSFTQKTATEANLKATKGTALMHIATHGFFLQDVESTGSAFGVNLENAGNNPLLRSGLMLAGAATTVSGTRMPNLESNDNGILTAYEAMNLNLEGTDLIVLSACETGLGDVKSGEGVYGLQRAFLVAGADALIMSLWKVDDAATQQLMTNFYTNWIKLGNKQKAFKQAQLQLMTKYKEPYYWGAFVMMGL
ncbi:CHAT domain-containing tetratricopeptide repeat protein [Chryseolinea lacunae]|uniref:CHAT domain-containing protein n=1 Tax=Chryseolinea lacunae TaxID=2801331 RepID=A0ABS1KV39_9BACT|nr:CHAT domain-containing protein [Chryseolinea lacunae]MBL0742567.1 CHAT domain-containing protein [Chryseolinea lacunae]